jgi:hypothetical protein
MEIAIDASELLDYAGDMARAADVLTDELEDATAGVLATGVGLAVQNAPIEDGGLRGDIRVIRHNGLDGEYGTDLDYSAQREFGGTIYPRNGKYLVFEIGGQLIFAKSVTQSGDFYMQKSADELRPLAQQAFSDAVSRALGRL